MLLRGRILREIATFALGAVGFLHELVIVGQERPIIIYASLALMGLPFFLRGEDKLRSGGEE